MSAPLLQAVGHTGAGDGGVLELRQVPRPDPGPGQVRVRVQASALNRADILQRKGRYPAPPGWPADIPGLEYAGEVDVLGPGVTRWKIGDRVMGLVGGGAHAEYVVVHADEAMAVPAGMPFTEAAAIPEAFLTAWDALVVRGRLQPGERVLIHAVGSGVGTAAVQLAKRLGATVAGSSRSAAKLERARELGMDEGIDSSGDWAIGRLGDSGAGAGSGSEAGTGDHKGRPYGLIIDCLGAPAFAANLEALAPRGRLVLLGFLQGASGELSLEPILRKRLEVIGSVMRTRALEERIPLVAAFSREVLPGFGDSAPPLRPVVAATYPFAKIAAAHQAMERDENFGKIVLSW
ncbi:MAG: NAD(P)H-quinone oxidoreductase [Gemmatimonadota bacterium]|nr:NAD(P)H-quinone oxidoreductase [Gemmatimonadota bacterium]